MGRAFWIGRRARELILLLLLALFLKIFFFEIGQKKTKTVNFGNLENTNTKTTNSFFFGKR